MIKDIPGLLDQIYKAIRAFTDCAVVGMSGGADSSLVAILAAQALGPKRVYSLHMPYGQKDWEKYNSKSWALAERLEIFKVELFCNEIADAVTAQLRSWSPRGPSERTQGNNRARARMALLAGVSATIAENNSGMRVRTLGAGELSKGFIGYYTKGGDVLATDLNPIAELYKSEVIQLLGHFKGLGILDDDHYDPVPSAGLWDGQNDKDELGFEYDELELAIRNLRRLGPRLGDDGSYLSQAALALNVQNDHKAAGPVAISLRSFCDDVA